jgi:hypothetical protein
LGQSRTWRESSTLRMKSVAIAQMLILTIIPAGLFFSSIFLHAIAGPYYLSGIFDPEYVYLLNALNLLNFQPPSHTLHPGTTLQVFGAIIILGKWVSSCAVGACALLNDSVLHDPEAYLETINTMLNLFIAGALVWAGIRVLRFTNMLLAGVTLQVTMFAFSQIEVALTRVSTEPLLVLSALVLILILIPEVFARHAHPSEPDMARKAILTGGALGFGLATKVTFFPLLSVVFLLQGRRNRLLAVFSCLAAFLVLTLPILSAYPSMATWFGSILVHQGRYGSGAYGLPEIDTLVENLAVLCSGAPFLFISLGFYVLTALSLKTVVPHDSVESLSKILALLWIGCVIIVVQIVVTVKHPGLNYMLPSMVFTGLLNAAIVFFYQAGRTDALPRTVVLIGVLAVGLSLNAVHLAAWVRDAEADRFETKELLLETKKTDGCWRVGYYRSPLIEYALVFGNGLSGHRYGDALQRLYPNAIFYNIWRNEFHSFVSSIQSRALVEQIREGRCILLFGSPLTGEYGRYRAKLVLSPVFVTSQWALYKLVGVRS